MKLTTLERTKRRIDELANVLTHDQLIDDMIAEVSKLVETYMDRGAQLVSRTQYLDVRHGQRSFVLRAWPVSSSPAPELRSNADSDFSDSGSVVITTDYRIDEDAGILYLTGHEPSTGPKTLRLVYTAGMGATPQAFAAAYPDIAGAVDAEVVERFRNRHRPDASSLSDAGGSISISEPDALMKRTLTVLDLYRREGMTA